MPEISTAQTVKSQQFILSRQLTGKPVNPLPMGIGDKIRVAREAKGWSQADLGREVAKLLGRKTPIRQQSILAIESGETQKSKFEYEILQLLDLAEPLGFRPALNPAVTNLRNSGRDGQLPVHAATEGGRGCMVISADAIAYVNLPDLIARSEDGYGIIVIGTSMVRDFNPGDTALVHKKLPPESGQAAVFYSNDGHGSVLATIKYFIRSTPTHWYVEQTNPKRKFTLPREEWQTCHRVVGKYSRR